MRDFLDRRLWLAVVLCVVGFAADFPQVGEHRLLAAGGVLLRHEVDLILRDVLQVTLTSFDGAGYCLETVTIVDLVLAERGGTFERVRVLDVETVAIGVLGRRYAVGTDEVVSAAVTVTFLRLCECTGYGLDTRSPYNFSHSE